MVEFDAAESLELGYREPDRHQGEASPAHHEGQQDKDAIPVSKRETLGFQVHGRVVFRRRKDHVIELRMSHALVAISDGRNPLNPSQPSRRRREIADESTEQDHGHVEHWRDGSRRIHIR